MTDYVKNNSNNTPAGVGTDQSMDWNDTLENDGKEFIILPEGDYNFIVTGFERGRFPGSAKISPSNKATLTLQVETDEGIGSTRLDLILNRVVEFKVSAFFRCIGQKKSGERLVMDWNNVVGSQGRAHFKPREYEKNGEKRKVNDVERFYDYDKKYFPAGTSYTGSGTATAAPKQVKWTEVNDEDLPF